MADAATADLYETDIVLWSERQADLLRRNAAGDRSNAEAPDWANIIEEIESVGREQINAVESLLVQAMLHLLKCQAWPAARHAAHWQAEVRGFRDSAAARYAPSMRQRIDMAVLYRRALRRLPSVYDNQPPLAVPDACPWTLEELLAE
jgi:hypothetical protein